MKQKLHMTDLIIRAGVAYAFYAIPFSSTTIKKFDKHIIRLYKKICGLSKSTPNITTQLSHNLFGLEAYSLSNAYLRCISKQLRDALYNPGQLNKIYQGLTSYILSKNGGAQKITRITISACIHSSTTCTLYLLKTMANFHVKSTIDNFLLYPIPLKNTMLFQLPTNPQIIEANALKNLYNFLLIHIININQLILPNGYQLKNKNNFPNYQGKLTKFLSYAFKLLTKLVYHLQCAKQLLTTILYTSPPKYPISTIHHSTTQPPNPTNSSSATSTTKPTSAMPTSNNMGTPQEHTNLSHN